MEGTLDGFSYGFVTPLVAFVMACLGGALGLRCTTRSVRNEKSFKAGWLALGALSIGTGIWTMHFIAMMGFSIAETPITYDRPITYASLAVAIVMVGIGVFIVGYRGATPMALATAGIIMGLGVASMHYLGMAGMRFQGQAEYSVPIVVLSVVIAVVAATAALWAAVSIHGFLISLGASLVMGIAVTGMHYTGMASVSVHLHGTPGSAALGGGGDSPASLLAPMLLGPALFLLVAAVVVMFDPLLMVGEDDAPRQGLLGRPAKRPPLEPGIPAPRAEAHSFPERPTDGEQFGQQYVRPLGTPSYGQPPAPHGNPPHGGQPGADQQYAPRQPEQQPQPQPERPGPDQQYGRPPVNSAYGQQAGQPGNPAYGQQETGARAYGQQPAPQGYGQQPPARRDQGTYDPHPPARPADGLPRRETPRSDDW